MAFSSGADPEVISAICLGVATVLGSIVAAIKKIQGKTGKEIYESFSKKTITEIADIAKKEAEIIKELVDKKEKEKQDKDKAIN